MKRILVSLTLLLLATITYPQVGIGDNPDASAALDVVSTTQGMLVPRMTEANRMAISSPAKGLLLYQIDATEGFYFYNGSTWSSLNSGSASATVTSDNSTLEGDGSAGTPLKVKNSGVTTTQIAPSGTDGQVLTTTSGATAWETPSLLPVTKAQKDAMTGAALNTMVYQTDDYPGIYVKQSDGWRCISGDTPITFFDIGTNPIDSGFTDKLILDASHHTIYVTGSWGDDTNIYDPIVIPDPTTCKGRKYRIIVNNTSLQPADDPPTNDDYVIEYGWGIELNRPYKTMDEDFNSSEDATYIPSRRAIVLQSDGTNWVEIQNDKTNYLDYHNEVGN